MRLKGQAPCKAFYRNKVIHPAPQPSAEGPAALPFYSGGHGGSVDKAAAGGLCPREAPRLPQGPPGTLLPMGPSSQWAPHPRAALPGSSHYGHQDPCSMRSWIFRPCWVPRGASCRSSWPSPMWQKPYLVAMYLHCVPLPQPGPPITKTIGGLEDVCSVRESETGERGWCL